MLAHPRTGQAFDSPVVPGTGWPGDPATRADPGGRRRRAGRRAGAPGRFDSRTRRADQRVPGLPAAGQLGARTSPYVKRRAFADQPYWGRPVPGWGSERPRLLIVGLAPAAHGANRTGRMFTGDRSGDQLVCGAASGRPGEPADQRRRRGRLAGQRRFGSSRRCAARRRPTPRRRRSGTPAGLAGGRMAAGVRTRPGRSWPWAGSPGRSRCDCRALGDAQAAVRPRRRGRIAARRALARLLPPQPAKHVYR